MVKAQSKRIFELDALRGIAALLVVLFHFTMGRKEREYGFKFGVTGVDLFFLISGFVILLTLEKTRTWKEFVVNRFSRLYPTYWACVTITTLALLIHIGFTGYPLFKVLPDYLANLTMFQLYFRRGDIDGTYWTMIVEMLFYIYMLLFFVFKQLKHIELISILFFPLIFIYSSSYIQTHFEFWTFAISIRLPLINHFPLFVAGIIFYKMKFDGQNLKRYIFLAICFICQLTLFKAGGRSHYYLSIYQYVPVLLVYFLVFYLYIINKLRFIVNKTTVFLGNISFSLYLIHQRISNEILMPFFTKYVDFWTACLISLLIVIVMAALINKMIEKPLMNYIRKGYRQAEKDIALTVI